MMDRRAFLQLLGMAAASAALPIPPSLQRALDAAPSVLPEPEFWLRLNGVERSLMSFLDDDDRDEIEVTHIGSPAEQRQFIRGLGEHRMNIEVAGRTDLRAGDEVLVETGHRPSGWGFTFHAKVKEAECGETKTALVLIGDGPAAIFSE